MIKDVLAIAVTLERDEPSLRAAGLIAEVFGAHAAALVLAVHPGSGFAEQAQPLSTVLLDLAAGARGAAATEHERISTWLAGRGGQIAIRQLVVEDALAQHEVLAHARTADLTVLTRGATRGKDRVRDGLLETLLFGAGRPLLLLPPGWSGEGLWDRILIGWDAKREAARAVADAMPFLTRATEVVVATVDASPRLGGHGPAPGHEIAVHLSRHDVRVRVENIDAMGRSEALALRDAAVAMDASMIVMGGYGHSRAAEWLFGGVTRELLSASPVPLLLSH